MKARNNGRRRQRSGANKGRARGFRSTIPRSLQSSGITTVDFSTQINLDFSITSGLTGIALFPHAVNFCQRFSDIAYSFEYYRITSLKYCFLPTTTRVSNEMFAHAVLPSDEGGLPIGSFAQLCQLNQTKIYDSRQVNIQWNHLGARALSSQPVKWYSTTDQGNTATDYIQCNLIAASSVGAVNNSLMVLFKFSVQFTSAAAGGGSLTPVPKPVDESPSEKLLTALHSPARSKPVCTCSSHT